MGWIEVSDFKLNAKLLGPVADFSFDLTCDIDPITTDTSLH
jgi:hypothetical protein